MKREKKRVILTISLDKELYDMINRMSRERKQPRSSLINSLLKEGLTGKGEDPKVGRVPEVEKKSIVFDVEQFW